MAKIRLSLKPLADARWEKEPQTGAEFQIAPLSGTRDREITQDCQDNYGVVDPLLFADKVAQECLKSWRGVGDGEHELPCNPENIKQFIHWHGTTLGPWLIRKARSLDHYREQEVEAAKKG